MHHELNIQYEIEGHIQKTDWLPLRELLAICKEKPLGQTSFSVTGFVETAVKNARQVVIEGNAFISVVA